MQEYPIGIFDSGLGGLTVMQQLMHALPHEDMIYFGDTARLPYGNKSPETVVRYCVENAEFLIHHGIKLLVVACNTASAHALNRLQAMTHLPVIGVIDPGVESALQATKNGKVAVLGTKGTIQSQCYQNKILAQAPTAFVLPIACPLFVPLVEEGFLDHSATRLIVQEYLKPIKKWDIDTLLLGCTHYPFLKKLIQEEVGDRVSIIDSAVSCAKKVAQLLADHGMKRSTESLPHYQYVVSDAPQQFQQLGSALLGRPISHVALKA